jgi:hypothetical protein
MHGVEHDHAFVERDGVVAEGAAFAVASEDLQ